MIRKKESGFTLIETVIAIFISILVIISSLYAFNRGMSLVQTTRNINIAVSDINAVCEKLRQEIDSAGGIAGLPRQFILPGGMYTVNIVGDAALNPMPVNVSISWFDESNRQRDVTVDMLITRRA